MRWATSACVRPARERASISWLASEREQDTRTLHRAVAAYRAALEVRTRECTPFDWATTHNNLGITLVQLSVREPGTEALEQAAEAFRAAAHYYESATKGVRIIEEALRERLERLSP